MKIRRVAIWSGPRNISTAMMRSFGSRADCQAVDEPFYACYLAANPALDHPMREAVLGSQPTDWQQVVDELQAIRAPLVYVKHMAHHLQPEMLGDWLTDWQHAMLIRHPTRVVVSLRKVLPEARLAATGLPQQVMIYEALQARGLACPMVDTDQLLQAPKVALQSLCNALDVAFDPIMLKWPAGTRPEDGIWAPAWYVNVYRSTGFGAASPAAAPSPDEQALIDQCLPYYRTLLPAESQS